MYFGLTMQNTVFSKAQEIAIPSYTYLSSCILWTASGTQVLRYLRSVSVLIVMAILVDVFLKIFLWPMPLLLKLTHKHSILSQF
jgi:hypothetical protein